MKTFAAGTDVILSVAFKRAGNPAVPKPGTVEFVVHETSGYPLFSSKVETGPADAAIQITVPAEHNQITTAFSRRAVIVRSSLGEQRLNYRLVPFTLFTVTPRDVRAFLGVNDEELPDDEVDLHKACIELQIQLGRDTFNAALVSGEAAELHANDAIKYKTALELIPSLANRIASDQTDGVISFKRGKPDFGALAREAAGRLGAATAAMTPRSEIGYSIFTTTNDADPITG